MTIVGCASGGGASTAPTRAAPPSQTPSQAIYVVEAGDTLYSIAWRHNLDYRDLAKWNGLGSTFRLAIGQQLLLQPNATLPATHSAGAPKPTPPRAIEAAGANNRSLTPGAAANVAAVATVGGMKWSWPTNPDSDPRPVPGGGILLFGRLGQDIRAAGSGRVVYTGNGIRGYGNLIIIKHGDTLLSSYAHNRELLVHEGQDVTMGQTIAHMGMGPHQVCALYFEIRVNGRPDDPLHYLAPL